MRRATTLLADDHVTVVGGASRPQDPVFWAESRSTASPAESRVLWSSAVRTTAAVALVAAAYYVSGLAGVALSFPPRVVSSIWLANAILLAALLLVPVRTWWLYLLAVFAAHIHRVAHFQPEIPLVVILVQFVGNALQAVIAALAVIRFVGPAPRLDTVPSLVAFILIAAVAAPAAASVLPASLFVLTGWASDFWSVWRSRVLSNVFATLTITPLILVAVAGGTTAWRRVPARRYAEFGLLLAALFVVGIAVFNSQLAGPSSNPALLYAPLPLLLWAAVRFGLSGVCLALLVVESLALASALSGHGPFATQSSPDNVLQLQIFMLVVALPLLLLAVVIDERARIARAIQSGERALKQNYAHVQDLAQRLIRAQEDERTRIARDLHDEVGQQLAAVAIGLSRVAPQLPADSVAEVSRLEEGVYQVARALRNLSHELHPGALRHLGLDVALSSHCREFAERHGVAVDFEAKGELRFIAPELALCLFRVVQEALRNVAEHAAARHVRVRLTRRRDALTLVIGDDGRGFDRDAAAAKSGLGLMSVEERVRAVGGHLAIITRPGRGTAIEVTVPVREEADASRDGAPRR